MILSPKKLGIGVLGATGRMGATLLKLILKDKKTTLTAVSTSSNSPWLGKDVGYLLGMDEQKITFTSNAEYVFKQSDVVIDFSLAQAVSEHLEAAQKTRKPFICCVTGMAEPDFKKMSEVAKSIPYIYAENTSFGITLLKSIVQNLAKILDDSYDIEISELHHRDKKDAPSGTALGLGKAAAKGRQVAFDEVAVFECHGKSSLRQPGDIGFSVRRGGSKRYEHTVDFIGDEEHIQVSHIGLTKTLFPKGALRVAQWLVHQKPGFYTMADFLGLHEEDR